MKVHQHSTVYLRNVCVCELFQELVHQGVSKNDYDACAGYYTNVLFECLEMLLHADLTVATVNGNISIS